MEEQKNKASEKENGACCLGKSSKKILWLVIIILVLGGAYFLGKKPINFKKFFAKNITQEEAKDKVAKFIEDNGGGATVKSATEENGMYKVVVEASGQEIETYVSKDGAKFFPNVVDFAEVEAQIEESKKQEEAANQPAPKTDKPVVDLYVMSFCPYGNKAEDTIKPVYDLLKNKADFNFRYIVSVSGNTVNSLHGQKEVDQNEREACVLKNYGKDKWMDFVAYVNANCGSDGACWQTGAKNSGIDVNKINTCVNSQGTALMKAEAEASTAAGATGSPTMIINGQESRIVYQYGDSEAYKKAICDAFSTAPEECSKTLSSATSTTAGGSCN